MNLKINWDHNRCKHAIERMWLRGVSSEEVKEAVIKGQKHVQKETGLTESIFRFYSVVYQEYLLKEEGLRKVYPITVKLW